MNTYRFDFSVVVDGDTEDDALEEAMQLLADYRFAKEAATVTLLNEEDDYWHEVRHYEDGNTTYVRLSTVGKFYVHTDNDANKVEMIPPSGYANHFATVEEAKQYLIDRGF